MSCKTPILRARFDDPTVQAVAANGVIMLPNVTSNTECADVDSGIVTLRKHGTYEVHFNATLVATSATDNVEVQMYRDGTPVPGAHAIATAGAVGNNIPMSFTALVTTECCGSEAIDFRSITASSVRIANVTIEAVN